MRAVGDRRLARDLLLLFVGQVVLLVAFRAVLPAGVGENESTDFTGFYRPAAERLADGQGLTVAEAQPALRYPPGYPALLATALVAGDAVGASRDATIDAVTVLTAALAGVLLHLIARRLFDRRHAWAASVLWLAYPLTLWTTKQPNSELPYMVVLYLGVLALLPVLERGTASWARAAGVGALLGLATTIRPAGLAVIPAVAVVLAWRVDGHGGRRIALAGAVTLAALVPVAAATQWMSWGTGTVVVLSDANEINLVEGMTFAVDSPAEADALPMPGGLRDFVIETQAREVELTSPGAGQEHLLDTVRDDPVVAAELVVYKALRSWYGTESFRNEGLIAAAQVVWVGLAVAGGVACCRRGGARRWYVVLVLATTLATWATAIAALSIVRYLVPTLGLMAPLAAVGVLTVFDRLRPGRSGAGSGAGAGAGAGEDEVLGPAGEPGQATLERA